MVNDLGTEKIETMAEKSKKQFMFFGPLAVN